ncbi:hypothetical protein G5C60_30430 [Streptomyces sp. HC44]|uniref:Uncharacterized protein n=1 Tax=Streptomyces scabichelini TaxID=2711217 RepID=A0A6G4VD92_9ACTN|nr:hypothetical protein [Streptomyces scabichelini]NGO11800.1 hypothetical protein [Streptomyces scabichelini]
MSDIRSSAAGAVQHGGRLRTELLGIYLNDHLAGAIVGTRRAQHMVTTLQGSELAEALEPIAGEIAQDRASLLDIMRRLGVPARRYKVYAGQLVETVGRLKSNGRLIRRSPLTSVAELEFLRLGVEGKAAGWRTLRRLSGSDERLDQQGLDELLERAQRQLRTLEDLRLREAQTVFRTT